MTPGRNLVRLVNPWTGKPGNFGLWEFENSDGIVTVHRSLLRGLEALRADLGRVAGEEVMVIVTSGTRTQADNERLAQELGWTDQGGLVSRYSRHLVQYGGIAADIKAFRRSDRAQVPQAQVGASARRYFDYVKDDYRDGHVHVDQRQFREHEW